MSTFYYLVGLILLMVLNGALVACQFGLLQIRYSKVNLKHYERLKQRYFIRRLISRASETARVLRFGVFVCSIGYGFFLYPVLMDAIFYRNYGQDPSVSLLLVILSLVVVVYFFYLLSELLPRVLAIAYPRQTIKFVAWLVPVFEFISWPLRMVLKFNRKWLFRKFGVESEGRLNLLDVEVQIRALGEEEHVSSPAVKKIIRNALQMQNLEAGDVLVPRHQLQYLDLTRSLEENLELARSTGHTRFPLCDGGLDKCIGLIHIKDLFRSRSSLDDLDLRNFKRSILRISLEEDLKEVLNRMLVQKMHMALVFDEFGGTVGVVTLERILEQLVGEIQDEFDVEELQVQKLGEGEFKVSGLTPVHHIEKLLHMVFENDEISTMGGLVTYELGRIPKKGDRVFLAPEVEALVNEVDSKRVLSVTLLHTPRRNISDEDYAD